MEQQASPLGAAEAAPGAHGHVRVLVTEDQASIAGIVEHTVRERLGCAVTVAGNGDEALALLGVECFDVMVTDMRMPGMHGMDLVRESARRWPDMGLIVMTGYPDEFPYVEVIQAGADDFIVKPFQPAELEAKLVRIFNEQRGRHQRRVAEDKYRSLFEHSVDGMLFLEGADWRVADVNAAFQDLVGATAPELLGASFLELLAPRDAVRFEHWLPVCAESGKGALGDIHIVGKNDNPRTADISATFLKAHEGGLIFLAFKDVTEKREVDRRLADAAQRDGLTGLMNKRTFGTQLEWAVAQADAAIRPLSLLMIDLDNFKTCNDTHGHQVGDELLARVGEVIRNNIRVMSSDEGFRCGGDEFAVLLPSSRLEDAVKVAERMQAEFAGIPRYGVTFSIGVAEWSAGVTPRALLDAADQALYQAKGAGKDAIVTA